MTSIAEQAASRRYVAFISYSHVDRAVARWLHRAIEGYRLPPRLRSRTPEAADQRLAPVFLDREELPTSIDLAESVRAALDQSDALIVVCSPTAARSRWVNEEARRFKELGRDARIFCLIVAGEPRAADKGFSPDLECLPPAMRFRVVDGVVSDQPAPEPLAADLRPGADSRRDAKLKIVAALLGLGLDELRRRDHARHQRRLAGVAAASVIGCLAFAALAVSAFVQRNEAERQRTLAEQKSLTAERTTDFMISLFKVSEPSEARGNAVTAREILDRGARAIDQSLRQEPQVRAELSTTLGEVYTGLGLYRSAHELLAKAGSIPGLADNVRLRQTVALAELEFQRGNDARADELLRSAAAQVARLGEAEASPALRARILLDQGDVAAFLERPDEARGHFEAALRLGNEHALADVTPRALEGIALSEFYRGEMSRAQRAYETALEVRIRRSGQTHPKVSESLTALGSIAYTLGHADEAESYWLRSLAVDERILGPKHPDLAVTLNNLGRLDLERRQFKRARERLTRAVTIYAAEQSETHEGQIFAWTNLALANVGLGDDEAAEGLLQRALNAAVATRHRLEGPIQTDLADLECRTRRVDAGLLRLAAAGPIVAERYPDDPWRTALVDNVRAGCLVQLRRTDEAERLVAGSLPVVLEQWPVDTFYGRGAVERATRVYTMSGNRSRLAEIASL